MPTKAQVKKIKSQFLTTEDRLNDVVKRIQQEIESIYTKLEPVLKQIASLEDKIADEIPELNYRANVVEQLTGQPYDRKWKTFQKSKSKEKSNQRRTLLNVLPEVMRDKGPMSIEEIQAGLKKNGFTGKMESDYIVEKLVNNHFSYRAVGDKWEHFKS